MYIYTHIHFSWFYCSLSTVYFIVFMPSLYTKLLSTLWDEGVHSILNWKTIKSSSLEHFCNHSLILILWRTSENIPAALTINVDQTNQDNMSCLNSCKIYNMHGDDDDDGETWGRWNWCWSLFRVQNVTITNYLSGEQTHLICIFFYDSCLYLLLYSGSHGKPSTSCMNITFKFFHLTTKTP